MNYRIVSFYTTNYKPIYEKYLKTSFDKLQLLNYVEEIPNFKDWSTATNYKPKFILKCLDLFPNENIVWTDIDSIITTNPILFEELSNSNYDFAYHKVSWEQLYGRPSDKNIYQVASGTMFFKNNFITKKFLNSWIEKTKNYAPDQVALEKTLNEIHFINIYNLPRTYCYIITKPNGEPPSIQITNPIIVHYQSSRKRYDK